MTLQERLQSLRKGNHLTQDQLASMLGVAKGTVAMWESGKRRPSFDNLSKMTEIYDRTLAYILGESDDISSPKLTDEEIDERGCWQVEEDFSDVIMKYLRLDARGKRAVEALIQTEFGICREEGTLFPREDFLLSLRLKKSK